MILLIDNYDSFTYNIAQAIGLLGHTVDVVRNDVITLKEIEKMEPEAIIISPGPGRPENAGISCDVIKHFAGRVPILGVCLGHQCIAQAFEARVERASEPVHGKKWDVYHDGQGIYYGLRNPFQATRYHSLIVAEDSVPDCMVVSAYTTDGEVMGLRLKEQPVDGVQFHPESIATDQGLQIFRNFLRNGNGGRL